MHAYTQIFLETDKSVSRVYTCMCYVCHFWWRPFPKFVPCSSSPSKATEKARAPPSMPSAAPTLRARQAGRQGCRPCYYLLVVRQGLWLLPIRAAEEAWTPPCTAAGIIGSTANKVYFVCVKWCGVRGRLIFFLFRFVGILKLCWMFNYAF